ncbi:MAG: hypothetical protein ACOCXW_00625, partial [Bacteroidota bacterium]
WNGFKGKFGSLYGYFDDEDEVVAATMNEKEMAKFMKYWADALNQLHDPELDQGKLSKKLQKAMESKGWTRAQADFAAQFGCVTATLYIELLASGAKVGSFSKFYKEMVNKG